MVRAAAVLVLAGCGEDGPIALPDAWEPAETDPFDDAPPDAICAPSGWGIEDGVLEIETDACAYATLSQPLLRDVRRGARITMTVWNLGTFAPEPTEAHVAVAIGDALWEERPAIPGPAQTWSVELDPDTRLFAGDPVYVHLHNHGANSWRFAAPEVE